MLRMKEVFESLAAHVPKIDFPERAAPTHRYYYENDFFSYGDAIILSAMIRELRPRKIIEVGSGFSSAAILDTLDRLNDLDQTHCTFIDPHDHRLQEILRSGDKGRVTIIKQNVQSISLQLFQELCAGDFLILDTTHVVKTGSDVVYESLEILPKLASGVLIHVHDMFDGFEYPGQWIFSENRSWNELYLVRAFLMYNDAFEIFFFNDRFAREYPDLMRAKCPLMARNSGVGMWLRKR